MQAAVSFIRLKGILIYHQYFLSPSSDKLLSNMFTILMSFYIYKRVLNELIDSYFD